MNMYHVTDEEVIEAVKEEKIPIYKEIKDVPSDEGEQIMVNIKKLQCRVLSDGNSNDIL